MSDIAGAGSAPADDGSPSKVVIRALKAEELPAARRVFATSLVSMPARDRSAPDDPYGEACADLGRWFGAFADGELVGTADSFGSWIAVPGGARVPHAGVSGVGVLPTHTRRGLLRLLMRDQLRDLADRGDVVATLRASEAAIYERFGYGVATRSAEIAVQRVRVRWRPSVPAGGPLRLVDPIESWDLLARIHEQVAGGRPGEIGRPPSYWNGRLARMRDEPGIRYAVVHGERGFEDGYGRYEPDLAAGWADGGSRILVKDLVAGTPRARAGLLRFLLGLDLTREVVFPDLPVDDALPALLVDSRAARITNVRDETWLRLVDVPAALAARSYAGPGRVTVRVSDVLLPANSGVYEISEAGTTRLAGPDAAADLALDVSALGAAYLGGTPLWQLAEAGRVDVRDPGALATADRLLATPTQPHCGTHF